MKKDAIRTLTRGALLSALAIAAAALEGLLPPLPLMPPGGRIGFSNIVSMYTASRCGVLSAMTVSLIKSLFVLLTRGPTAFLMSLLGGLLSTLVTSLLLTRGAGRVGCVGIGVLGAAVHNASQLCVSALLVGSGALYYLPFLIVVSCVSGSLTGGLLYLLIKISRRLP